MGRSHFLFRHVKQGFFFFVFSYYFFQIFCVKTETSNNQIRKHEHAAPEN